MAEREQPAAAPLRAGVPFPSPRPPRHSRGPVPTRPVPLPPSLPVLQIHLQDLPVALKEALHIALPGLVAQAADVHPRHPGNGGGGLAGPQPPLGGGRQSESAAAAAAATDGRRNRRNRTPATYASTQLASTRLPPFPPSPKAEGNERERAFSSRPARGGGGTFPGTRGRGAEPGGLQAGRTGQGPSHPLASLLWLGLRSLPPLADSTSPGSAPSFPCPANGSGFVL